MPPSSGTGSSSCGESEMGERKPLRLKEWNYSTPGYYFVTICTQEKRKLFPVGAAPCGRLDLAGDLAERWLEKLPKKFPEVLLDKYVIMPNHVHCILRILPPEEAGGHMGPPLHISTNLKRFPLSALKHFLYTVFAFKSISGG